MSHFTSDARKKHMGSLAELWEDGLQAFTPELATCEQHPRLCEPQAPPEQSAVLNHAS